MFALSRAENNVNKISFSFSFLVLSRSFVQIYLATSTIAYHYSLKVCVIKLQRGVPNSMSRVVSRASSSHFILNLYAYSEL